MLNWEGGVERKRGNNNDNDNDVNDNNADDDDDDEALALRNIDRNKYIHKDGKIYYTYLVEQWRIYIDR